MNPESFANTLRERIRALHDGRLPSAGDLARALNAVDGWRRPVSTETMRRWIRGLSLPELHRVPALCEWLGCAPDDLLSADLWVDAGDALGAVHANGRAAAVPLMSAQPIMASSSVAASTDAQPVAGTARGDPLQTRIIECMAGMSRPELEALATLLERRGQPPR